VLTLCSPPFSCCEASPGFAFLADDWLTSIIITTLAARAYKLLVQQIVDERVIPITPGAGGEERPQKYRAP
jgi:hypothetical protein